MSQVDRMLDEATVLAHAGNLIDPLRACVAAMGGATPQDRALLAAAIRHFIGMSARRTSTERQLAASLLDGLNGECSDIARSLRALDGSDLSELAPGHVNVLLAMCAPALGRTCGVVAELQVDSQPAGGSRRIAGGDTSLESAYESGVKAGIAYLHRNGFGSLDSSILFNARSFDAAFSGVKALVAGNSIALGAAVATISAALEIRVPAGTGFTGAMNLDGRVCAVGDLDAKISAAADKGLLHVFAPAYGAQFVSKAGVEVVGVLTLDEVVGHVFEHGVWESAVERARRVSVPASMRLRRWPADDEQDDVETVLLSAVAFSDPVGRPRPRHAGDVPEIEDGPTLALAVALAPARVLLLHTRELADRAIETKAAIRHRLELDDHAVVLVALDDGVVPNDAETVFPAVRRAVLDVLDGIDPALVRLATNVTTGTPQMQLALHLLVERGVLPDRRYQVLESRDVAPGASRARRVSLPLM